MQYRGHLTGQSARNEAQALIYWVERGGTHYITQTCAQHVSVCASERYMSHIALYQNQHEQFVIVYRTLGEDQDKRTVQSECI